MPQDILSVREMAMADIELIASYWMNAEETHLASMGVDINKLPTRDQLISNLSVQLTVPLEERASYFIIWERNNIPVGYSNTRPTYFGKDAFMHLHLWDAAERRKGIGYELVKLTLPWFFNNLQLKDLYCEPYAFNPAPNKTMEKAGFDFVKEYSTIPGASNFEQTVKLWHLSHSKFKQLYGTG